MPATTEPTPRRRSTDAEGGQQAVTDARVAYGTYTLAERRMGRIMRFLFAILIGKLITLALLVWLSVDLRDDVRTNRRIAEDTRSKVVPATDRLDHLIDRAERLVDASERRAAPPRPTQ